MDFCSYFVKNRAMFGSFPSTEGIGELEREGVRYFVNLTNSDETKITPYKSALSEKSTYIAYPIKDLGTPHDWRGYARFIIKLSDTIRGLRGDSKLYLHCKGGHGRSGVVVASLLCYMFGMSPERALEYTTKFHNNRKTMRDKWRAIGSPQTSAQKTFVFRFFENLFFYRAYKKGYTAGFSNFSLHPVRIEGVGTFPTAEAAFQAHKKISDKEYVRAQENARTPVVSKHLGSEIELRDDWYKVKDEVMYTVLKAKFDQNDYIRENLMNTGLKNIVYHNNKNSYWGDGGKPGGCNKIGKILMRIRSEYYLASEESGGE